MGDQSSDLSRRRFLTTGAIGVAGFAASATLGGLPGAVEAASGPAGRDRPDLTPLGADIVAHVRDASAGQVALFVGTREVTVNDPMLVGRLLAGARRAGPEE